MSEQPVSQNPDRVAERQAAESAANGNWEAFMQPGAALDAGEIAMHGVAELTQINSPQTDEAASDDAVEHFGFAQQDSGVLVPAEGTKTDVHDSGFVVSDTRRNTMESVEDDFQTQQEALRQPLQPSEMSAAADKIGQAILKNEKALIGEGVQTFGDMLGIFRLKDMLNGGSLPFANDAANLGSNKTIGDRLSEAETAMRTQRIVDADTREVKYVGYGSGDYYQVARAKELYEALTADPKSTREDVLGASGDMDLSLLAKLDEPLTVPDSEIIPVNQQYDATARYTFPSTPTDRFGGWVGELKRAA